MKTLQLRHLKFVLKEQCTPEEQSLEIHYQIYAHDYDTAQQSVMLSDLLKAQTDEKP